MFLASFLLWCCAVSQAALFAPTFAQTLTDGESNNKVTATVRDHTDPSAPILVSPTNNSTVTTQKPNFTWEPSTDDVGVHHYQLIIDGSVFINSINTTATDNSTYKLVINGDSSLTLTPKNNIGDGTHTWRIVAYDAEGNSETSATWTFIIDSQAPNFTLTQIGGTAVNISAQDSSTWSTTAVTVTENPPLLRAVTEVDSEVTVTVIWGGQTQQTVTTNANSYGNWNTLLGVVPRDTEITLNFLIRDGVGLTTVLENVKFIVPSSNAPTATPTPGSGVYPTTPPVIVVISTTPEPTVPPGFPTRRPTKPPSVILRILDWNWPGGQGASPMTVPPVQEALLNLATKLPEPLATPLKKAVTTPPAAQPWWWSLVVLLTFMAWISATWLWYLSQWRSDWAGAGFPVWRGVMGPWFSLKDAESLTGRVLVQLPNTASPKNPSLEPLSFAKITLLTRLSATSNPAVVETIFSDHAGRYLLPKWPLLQQSTAGQYALSVMAPGKSTVLPFMDLPTDWPKIFSAFSYLHHQYRGGWLSLRKELPFPSLNLLVKTDAAPALILSLGKLLGHGASLQGFAWVCWLGFAVFYSSIWGGIFNWLMVGFFVVVGGLQLYRRQQLQAWPIEPVPNRPVSWIIVTARSLPARSWAVATTQKSLLLPGSLQHVVTTEIGGLTVKQTKHKLEMIEPKNLVGGVKVSYLN